MFCFRTAITTVIILCKANLFAQSLATDTSKIAGNNANLVTIYYQKLGADLRLYNGSEYSRYGHGYTGTPFFNNSDFTVGSVYYDGVLYPQIGLLYDVVQDELVIKDYTKNYELKLVKMKVGYFDLFEHRFVNLAAQPNNENIPEEGYFEILLEGKVTVLQKVQKKIEASSKAEEPTKFTSYTRLYLKKANEYFKIDNVGALVKAFKDKKNEVRKYIRTTGLSKKNMEKLVTETTNYYNSITQ